MIGDYERISVIQHDQETDSRKQANNHIPPKQVQGVKKRKLGKIKPIAAAFIFVISLGALSIPAANFVQIMRQTSGLRHLYAISADGTIWETENHHQDLDGLPGGSDPEALVALASFDSSQKRLSVNMWIDLSPLLYDGSLRDTNGHALDDTNIKKWLSRSATVLIGYRVARDVPLGSLMSVNSLYSAPQNFDIQLDQASSERYPGDWYALPLNITVELPSGLVNSRIPKLHNAWANNAQGLVFPTVALSAGTALSQYRLAYTQQADPNLDVEITRTSRQELFIWAVALTPLLLLLLAVISRRADSPVLSIEFAAAMLAVLPLRLVLVPIALDQITALDYLLAGELVLTVSVASFLLIVSSRKEKRKSPAASAAGEQSNGHQVSGATVSARQQPVELGSARRVSAGFHNASTIPTNEASTTAPEKARSKTDLARMVSAGVLRPGTRIVLSYRQTDYWAEICADGRVRLEATGEVYTRVDEAGCIIRQTRTCDGMKLWCVIGDDGTRVSLRSLRDKARETGTLHSKSH